MCVCVSLLHISDMPLHRAGPMVSGGQEAKAFPLPCAKSPHWKHNGPQSACHTNMHARMHAPTRAQPPSFLPKSSLVTSRVPLPPVFCWPPVQFGSIQITALLLPKVCLCECICSCIYVCMCMCMCLYQQRAGVFYINSLMNSLGPLFLHHACHILMFSFSPQVLLLGR